MKIKRPKSIAQILNNKTFTLENLNNIPFSRNVINFDKSNLLAEVTVAQSKLSQYIGKMSVFRSSCSDGLYSRHSRN